MRRQNGGKKEEKKERDFRPRGAFGYESTTYGEEFGRARAILLGRNSRSSGNEVGLTGTRAG